MTVITRIARDFHGECGHSKVTMKRALGIILVTGILIVSAAYIVVPPYMFHQNGNRP